MWVVAGGLDNTVLENSELSLQASGTILRHSYGNWKQAASWDKAEHITATQDRKTMVTSLDTFRVNPGSSAGGGNAWNVWAHRCLDSHEEATMLTMMDEEVLELCTRTVTSTPITSPATGLDIIELLLKNCPATFPEKQARHQMES